MRWTSKARIQRLCAALPRGDVLYLQIQRRAGNLKADPSTRVSHHVRMLRALREAGVPVDGARCLEVGTGHLPTLPILFHLAGAREIVTVDLHPRLQWDLTARAMSALAADAEGLLRQYEGLVDGTALRGRLAVMQTFADRPQEFFREAGIRYAAPADASAMAEDAGSFDVHFSTTVLEHIEPAVLADILVEARRLLAPGGVACHIVDPSDHFAHGDPAISAINFLRFSAGDWKRIAGNEFGYCNRLRAPDIVACFSAAGFDVLQQQTVVDDRALCEVRSGFPLDGSFRHLDAEAVCAVSVTVTARAA